MNKLLSFLVATIALISCNNEQKNIAFLPESLNDTWLGTLALNDSTMLPFVFNIANGQELHTILDNSSEKIMLETEYIGNDSIVMNFPVYQSRIVATFTDSTMTGYFEKTDAIDYRVPFSAKRGVKEREQSDAEPCCKLAPRWQTTFFENGKEKIAHRR